MVLFQLQGLLLTVLNTAGGTQVLGDGKDSGRCESADHAQDDDPWKRHRCSSLDGLMVCQRRPLAQLSYFMIIPSL